MTISPPTTDFDESPTVCVTLNEDWISHIVGLIDPASKERYWDTGDQYTATQQIEQIIRAFTLGNCEPMPTYSLERVRFTHTETQNTNGGTTAANAWTAIPVTSIDDDESGSASLGSNVMGVPSGSLWTVHAHHVFRCNVAGVVQMRIRGAIDYYSVQVQIPAGGAGVCVFSGKVSTTIGRTLTWEYYATQAQTNTGLGSPMNVTGKVEVYGEVFLERLKVTP